MPRGGKRSGAGRPVGTHKYGEPTQIARIPISVAKRLSRVAERDQKPLLGNPRLVDLALQLIESGVEQASQSCSDPQTQRACSDMRRGLDLLRYALAFKPDAVDPVEPGSPLRVGDRCRYIGQDDRLQQIAADRVLVVQGLPTPQIATVIVEGLGVRNFPITDLQLIQSWDLALNLHYALLPLYPFHPSSIGGNRRYGGHDGQRSGQLYRVFNPHLHEIQLRG
jgi:hypothetical protein